MGVRRIFDSFEDFRSKDNFSYLCACRSFSLLICFVKRECNEFFVHRLHKERDAAQLATQLDFRSSTANCALVERSGLQSLADAECAVLRGRERNDLDLESLLSLSGGDRTPVRKALAW